MEYTYNKRGTPSVTTLTGFPLTCAYAHTHFHTYANLIKTAIFLYPFQKVIHFFFLTMESKRSMTAPDWLKKFNENGKRFFVPVSCICATVHKGVIAYNPECHRCGNEKKKKEKD